MNPAPTKRFSSRIKDYILYRPGYPKEIISFLAEHCGLKSSSVVADIGSGTGKSAELFLENRNMVFGVEPNMDMRLAAENLFHDNPLFISINGTAEQTRLPDHHVDMIIAGQAFHWFDYTKAKVKFHRILKPGGYIILIWNERPVNQVGFMGAYDDFLKEYSTDYEQIDHRNVNETILAEFYAPDTYKLEEFQYKQVFDFTGLKGRYDSASYAIPAYDPGYDNAIKELKKIFEQYQTDGNVVMEYVTKVYWGKVGK